MITRYINKAIFKLIGWKNAGHHPGHIKKAVVIAVPHTSNWDFPIGIMSRASWNINIRFVGKKSLFKPPLGWYMKWMGGYPVDRTKHTNFIEAVTNIYKREDEFMLCLAPEGTRKKVRKLKRGFYFIAKNANVPIILVKFNFKLKEVNYSEPFYVTDNIHADLAYIYDYFRDVPGKIPANGFNEKYNKEE